MIVNDQMDGLCWKIVAELEADARLRYAEVGRRVGLSTPAAAERVRLEESGVITGYGAQIRAARIGLTVGAFIRIRLSGAEATAKRLTAMAADVPEIVECHWCTGGEAFILKAMVGTVAELQRLIDRLKPFGMRSASLILSTPVEKPTPLPAGKKR